MLVFCNIIMVINDSRLISSINHTINQFALDNIKITDRRSVIEDSIEIGII